MAIFCEQNLIDAEHGTGAIFRHDVFPVGFPDMASAQARTRQKIEVGAGQLIGGWLVTEKPFWTERMRYVEIG